METDGFQWQWGNRSEFGTISPKRPKLSPFDEDSVFGDDVPSIQESGNNYAEDEFGWI